MVIVKGEGAVLGLNLRYPIVTNGTLLRRYVEVRTAIELSFGVVSGVGPGIPVEVHVPQGERAVSGMVSGIFRHLRRIVFSGRNDVLIAEKVDNISLRRIHT